VLLLFKFGSNRQLCLPHSVVRRFNRGQVNGFKFLFRKLQFLQNLATNLGPKSARVFHKEPTIIRTKFISNLETDFCEEVKLMFHRIDVQVFVGVESRPNSWGKVLNENM